MFSNNSSMEISTKEREKSVQELQTLYGEKRDPIQTRLNEFKQILNRNDDDVFAELCFCLLTPQSSAKTCWAAVSRLKERSLLLKGEANEIQPQLNDVRFSDSKAKYIVEARATFSKDGKLSLKSHLSSFANMFELREWMVENVKGLGYKEASHFLRNVGLGEEFAILDRHILRNLKRLDVISEVPVSITKKRYLEIEEKLRRFSREVAIPLADLDLLFWSRETGWIFKQEVGKQAVGKIGVMADKETAIYFKLGGVKNSWVVKSEDEAVKTFEDIKNKQTVSLVIVTDTVFEWIKDKVGQGKKEIELPLVVSIPTRRGGKSQVDLLAELIKRTVGVEIRVQ